MKTDQNGDMWNETDPGRGAGDSMKREMERLAREWDDTQQGKGGAGTGDSGPTGQEFLDRVIL